MSVERILKQQKYETIGGFLFRLFGVRRSKELQYETIGGFLFRLFGVSRRSEQSARKSCDHACRANLEQTKAKLHVAVKALEDIKNWNEDLEDEWDDPGERANIALEKIAIFDGS